MGRLLAIALILSALGLPITDPFRYGLFALSLVPLVLGTPRRGFGRWIAAFAVAAGAVVTSALLPVPQIQEGHNVFLNSDRAPIYRAALPAAVVDEMEAQFDAQYPPENWCGVYRSCWAMGRMPEQVFAFSADAVWSRPAYSRIVEGIGFDDLRSFRGGFVNQRQYNWHRSRSDVLRPNMPFFVMYELPPDLAGGNLCWRGTVMWETSPDSFEKIEHAAEDCRPIVREDSGRRVFGLSILHEPGLAMTLEPPAELAQAQLIGRAVAAAAVLLIVLLLVDLRFRRDAWIAAFWIGAGLGFILVLEAFGNPTLAGYPIYRAANDGLTNESLARGIVQSVLAGDWVEALRGEQDIYWDMPGLRYARAFGSFLFGDTAYGYLTVVLALPAVLYLLLRRLVGRAVAIGAMAVFIVVPIVAHFAFAYFGYVTLYREGLGEAMSYTAFLAAIALYLHIQETPENGLFWRAFAANLLFALALAIRPNIAPGAAAFLLGYLICATTTLEARTKLILAGLALLPLALIPLHNAVFGGEWVMIAATATIETNLWAPPAAYWGAAQDIASGNWHGADLATVSEQLFRWLRLLTDFDSWLSTVPHVLVLAVVVAAACRRALPLEIRLLAWSALALHPVLWFWEPDRRHAMLAWLLSYLVAIAYAANRASRRKTSPRTV